LKSDNLFLVLKEISKFFKLKRQFVLDEKGTAPVKPLNNEDYIKYFNPYDINQGWIGNFFHIGALMSLLRNKQLLQIIVPSDNLQQENMNTGAYHFRLWRLGYWHDIVIDDYLPTNESGDLLFSYNKMFPNEFWVPLFEKALAKLEKVYK
jgi:hypothetical protein